MRRASFGLVEEVEMMEGFVSKAQYNDITASRISVAQSCKSERMGKGVEWRFGIPPTSSKMMHRSYRGSGRTITRFHVL